VTVHNHGTEDGAGVGCPERRVNGRLIGECLLFDRAMKPCGVMYSTPGECGWCGWRKEDHEQVRSLVYACPVCGDRYHDPSWDDIDDHWQGHLPPFDHLTPDSTGARE
jgi:hypothetical protein